MVDASPSSQVSEPETSFSTKSQPGDPDPLTNTLAQSSHAATTIASSLSDLISSSSSKTIVPLILSVLEN